MNSPMRCPTLDSKRLTRLLSDRPFPRLVGQNNSRPSSLARTRGDLARAQLDNCAVRSRNGTEDGAFERIQESFQEVVQVGSVRVVARKAIARQDQFDFEPARARYGRKPLGLLADRGRPSFGSLDVTSHFVPWIWRSLHENLGAHGLRIRALIHQASDASCAPLWESTSPILTLRDIVLRSAVWNPAWLSLYSRAASCGL